VPPDGVTVVFPVVATPVPSVKPDTVSGLADAVMGGAVEKTKRDTLLLSRTHISLIVRGVFVASRTCTAVIFFALRTAQS